VFISVVGLSAGPSFVSGLQTTGISLAFVGLFSALLPHTLAILFGYYVLKMNPLILLGVCAGAGTITAALRAVQDEAKSNIPALGYTVPYAIGNILLMAWGPVRVVMMSTWLRVLTVSSTVVVPEGEIEVKNIVVWPPGSQRPSVKAVPFNLAAGESLAVVGSSGNGKSSLARAGRRVEAQRRRGPHWCAAITQWNPNVFGKHVGYKSGIGRCFGIFPVMAVSGKWRHNLTAGKPCGPHQGAN
jgi:ABC-type multidrug transport system fused ATPase/permease subunit